MTNKELRLKCLLEAADLLRDIENPSSGTFSQSILTEAAAYDITNMDILTEAVEDVSDVEKAAKDVNDEKTLKKFADKVKSTLGKVGKWYYKIEPDKKFKALRTALKICSKLLTLTLFVFGVLYNMKGFGSMISGILKTNLYPFGNVGMILFGILNLIVGEVLSYISGLTIGAGANFKYKYNMADYEANMKELEKMRDDIDAKLEKADGNVKKELLKSKKDIMKAIVSLKKYSSKFYKNNEE